MRFQRVFHSCALLAAAALLSSCGVFKHRVKLAAKGPDAREEIDLSGPGWKVWLDKDAKWENDPLFLPPLDLAKIPVNAPTGGWPALDSVGVDASVPGTAEEYFQTTPGPEGDVKGVSWWWRDIEIPKSANGRRLLLRFEAARQRAEVYIDGKLAGYDLIGNTPFEADLTGLVTPGATARIAVRVTDPGGNFIWKDKGTIDWGENKIPLGHGFGGVTGRVRLIACDSVYIDDLYIQNTPAMRKVNVRATLRNTTMFQAECKVTARVYSKAAPQSLLAALDLGVKSIAPGESVLEIPVDAPGAKLWSPDTPILYTCEVSLTPAQVIRPVDEHRDAARETFGFRWFEAAGIGTDAMFLLNGKRIVLRSAISWGFFPTNGVYATPEMAEKQIRAAKSLGLNMLNFHRCVGQPVIFEKADELGLLYYEEPGNYHVPGGRDGERGVPALADQNLARKMAREKWLGMVRRDRSHPSMIIYSMSNETSAEGEVYENYIRDMKDAHALDPSRIFVRASGLRSTPGLATAMDTKAHMRPFDDTVYDTGWFDNHHAGGPAVWTQSLYKSPTDYYNDDLDKREIVFYGEEGAISTPPRLGLIKQQLATAPHLGWDGKMYLDWDAMFEKFITDKNLRGTYADADALCAAMGNISMEHQGRKIQLARLNNETDGYVINGWEAEIIENHSGVVDCFRNPKGDPQIMARYGRPLFVAVMPRDQVMRTGGKVVVDFYLINETDLKGHFKLTVSAKDKTGAEFFTEKYYVDVTGGNTYGQPLQLGVEIELPATAAGMNRVSAVLGDMDGKQFTDGADDIFGVDWQSADLPGKGAVLDGADNVRGFLQSGKKLDAKEYSEELGRLDWIVADCPPDAARPVPVPAAALFDKTGKKPGLHATYFTDRNFAERALERDYPDVNIAAADGSPPESGFPTLANYSVRWEGTVVAPASGEYVFIAPSSDRATVLIKGRNVTDKHVDLTAGEPTPITVEWKQGDGAAHCRLMWTPPGSIATSNGSKIIERVRRDGTTLVAITNAADWVALAAKDNPAFKYNGTFAVGKAWAGGEHFARPHPLLKDLPDGGALDWPYQAVVRNGLDRTGLKLEGEDLAAGAFHANTPEPTVPPSPIALGAAVGSVPCGKGRVVFSTLDVGPNLREPAGPADVARKLLCNFIEFAGAK